MRRPVKIPLKPFSLDTIHKHVQCRGKCTLMQDAWLCNLFVMLARAPSNRVTLHADTSGIPGTLLAAIVLHKIFQAKTSFSICFGRVFLACHALACICAILRKLALGWKSVDSGHLGRAEKINPIQQYLSGDDTHLLFRTTVVQPTTGSQQPEAVNTEAACLKNCCNIGRDMC